jgi:hypothetical protein
MKMSGKQVLYIINQRENVPILNLTTACTLLIHHDKPNFYKQLLPENP